MKHFFLAFVFALLFFIPSIVFSQNVIALWNFDNFTMNPQVGSGSFSLIGGVTHNFNSTGIRPGLSLPAGLPETTDLRFGVGLQTLNYPAQGTNPRTAGIQVNVSTVGFKNILFSVDVRQGGTSANKLVLLYTIDAVNWQRAVTYTTDDNDTWYLRNYNFSNIPGVNNNSRFAIRIVTNFDDDVVTAQVYVPVRGTVAYERTGPIRFDNIRLRGTPLSTPDDDRLTITSWNFDARDRSPSHGNGTLVTIGGITEDWTRAGIIPNQTIVGEGVFDHAALREGASLATLNYPASNSNNKTAGIQFNVNTSGYQNIYVSADVRHGNTSADNMFIQYSIDGQHWIDAQNYIVNSGDSWFTKDFDFSQISAVNNNPNFAIRYVTAFNGVTYLPAGGPSRVYLTTGPIRYDNILVKGNMYASTNNVSSNRWFFSGNKLVFDQMPQSNVLIFNISGQKVAEYSPALEIEVNLPAAGIYLFRTGNISGKISR